MSKIIRVLNIIAPITENDCASLVEIFSTTKLSKGEYWIREGKKNERVAFVEEGYMRKYYLKDGKELTDFFYFENDFSADLPSIITKTSPQGYIVAMQETTLITFSYYDFDRLCKSSLALEHLNRVILELTFARFYKRAVSFIQQTAKERYHALLIENPKVIQMAAQYHIASYLGISPQHLSRLRSEKS